MARIRQLVGESLKLNATKVSFNCCQIQLAKVEKEEIARKRQLVGESLNTTKV